MEYFGTRRELVAHAFQVYGLSRAIGLQERLTPEQMTALECAAVMHDIGVPECMRVHSCIQAEYQEMMGAKIAGEMLRALECPPGLAERIVFLIAHHHSGQVGAPVTLQILMEAEMLVGFDAQPRGAEPLVPEVAMRDRFRTKAGREVLNMLFGVPLVFTCPG